ncbi:MAG: branched-chain amino acid transport system ATP-binding protein [Celeribacter sp.]|jgi:branched-chain amino acid transport system ATP-binding protein
MSQQTPVLQVSGLNKAFGAVVVANDLNLTIQRGECIGVIGPNGAGKSSVFSLIAGVLPADSGKVVLSGQDITQLPVHKRVHKGIGRAFQIPQPFNGLTVYENVLSSASSGAGLRGAEARDWACDVIERTGLESKADTLAGSLTLLDRKNLEVAKAVATRADLLMLDEIGAGLTDREVALLIERIAVLKKDHAIIWIEHIAHALKAVADRIVVLNFGEKVADGPFDQVMSSAIVREIYMGLKDEPLDVA